MTMASLPLLPLLFLFVTASALHTCDLPTPSSTIPIFHIYGKCSPFNSLHEPRLDPILTMANNDPSRIAYLSSLISTRRSPVPIASGQQLMNTANYVVRARLGTPPQTMFMVLDTSSDSTWVPCTNCTTCTTITTFFSPSNSSTYTTTDCSNPLCSQLHCETPTVDINSTCTFSQSYGGDMNFSGVLSRDSLTLGVDVIQNFTFGCVDSISGSGSSFPKQGLIGLGRGPGSLLGQTGGLYGGVFSYCLPSFRSYYFSGSLRLGLVDQPTKIKTTPLLRNPHRPSLYYVNLTGISVGKTNLNVEGGFLTFDPVTGAGTIIDTGTVISRFVTPLYYALRDEFRKQVGAAEYTDLGAFDTCFATTADGGPVTPTVRLHFEGMDLVLPMESTLFHSSGRPLACLAMGASPGNVNSVLNVIANLQQQNHRVLIDSMNSIVGFARELCS